jgi:hypothetical protein
MVGDRPNVAIRRATQAERWPRSRAKAAMPTLAREDPPVRSTLRPFRLAWSSVAGLSLALALTSAAAAQTTAVARPAPGTPTPLANYIPADDLVFYFEFQGVESHPDAWKKSALYKVLFETPTGDMLDDTLVQLADQALGKVGARWGTGKEEITLLQHLLKQGFVVAASEKQGDPQSSTASMVFRGVFKTKEMKAIVARFLNSRNDPKVKPKYADADGHKIVIGKQPTGSFFAWWVDKEDLVMVPTGPTEAAVIQAAKNIFATLDGKTPSAAQDTLRTSLAKEEDGFVPIGFGFLDLSSIPPGVIPPTLGLQDLKTIDFRWGFQDKETVSILHATAPKPREGILALFDQPTFDKTNLPPIPEGVEAFNVISIDPKKAFDQISALAQSLNPNGVGLEALADAVKAKTKRDLKTDILGHLGPRIAIYVAPGAKSSDGAKGPNPLAALLGPLAGAMANFEIPRLTIVADIDDPTAVGRVLDELMIMVNQSLRSLGPIMPPADDPNGGAARKSRGNAGAGLEFTSLPNDKYRGYKLNLPQGLAALLPSYVRPTIRVAAKQIVFSISPEAARQAIEIKGGGAAATTFSTALQSAPAKMIFLQASDPSDAIAAALADFPNKLQQTLDAAATPPGALVANTPGGSGMPGGPGMAGSGGMSRPGGPAGFGASGPMGGGTGAPSGSGGRSIPGGSGGPGGGPGGSGGSGGAPASSPSGIVIKVDSSKLPTTSTVKALLFPGTATISVDDEGIKFITREAFPNVAGLVAGAGPESMFFQQMLKGAKGQQPVPMPTEGTPGANPAAPAAPGAPGGSAPGGRPGGGRRQPGGGATPGE